MPAELHRHQLSRRKFLVDSSQFLAGLLLTTQLHPERKSTIDDLISKGNITLGNIDLTAASQQKAEFKIYSSSVSFPDKPLTINALQQYPDINKIPSPTEYFVLDTIQSLVKPDTPVIFWGHSGNYQGEKLPCEGLREIIEGNYVFDKTRNEYVAKFVGRVQSDYRIRQIIQKKNKFQARVGTAEELLELSSIQILPHTNMNAEAISALFQHGKAKIATCGTFASFAVNGAQRQCERFGISNEPQVRNALNTLNVPDASGSDIYDAMLKIYSEIKNVNPDFARFFLAAYSRQIEVTDNNFRNLSPDELAAEPIPGINQTGIPFFTAKQIYCSFT